MLYFWGVVWESVCGGFNCFLFSHVFTTNLTGYCLIAKKRLIAKKKRLVTNASKVIANNLIAKTKAFFSFYSLHVLLGRRDLPIAVKLHCDWKPGLAGVAKKHFQTVVQDCEHMYINLRKKATPKASPPDRMKWVKKFLSAAATLPTSTMLHLVLERSLERMDEVWECKKFSQYLCRRYLCFAACDVEAYGVDRMRSAKFWRTDSIRLANRATRRRSNRLRPATCNSKEV